MKTAHREHPNRWAKVPSNRAPGAVGLNRSCSIYRAAKQEKLQLLERCFFLTSTFIELIGRWQRTESNGYFRVADYLPGISSMGP